MFELFDDGIVILGDSTHQSTHDLLFDLLGLKPFEFPLIVADPPYGNIVKDDWDRITDGDDDHAIWMKKWTEEWARWLAPGGAFYVWGGIGKPGFRPFFKYINLIEESDVTDLNLANLITWSKKRAYGVKHNYLFTREECAYFCRGDIKKPRCFNIPLLDVKRGYVGYNKKYPAKSEFKRRTNVWFDVTEVMRGKDHPTQKAQRVIEIPIAVHTRPGEWVLDPFAGGGTTGAAARALGRRFVLIEKDETHFDTIVRKLRNKSKEKIDETK